MDVSPEQTVGVDRGRLETLYELSIALSTTNSAEQIAARTLDAITAEVDCAHAWMVEIEQADDTLRVLDEIGVPERLLEILRARTAPQTRALRQAADTCEPVWLGSPEQIRARLSALGDLEPELSAFVWWPLCAAGEPVPIGALAVAFDRPREANPENRAYLDAVAESAGQALHLVRLRHSEAAARRNAAAAADRAERVGALAAALASAQTVAEVTATLSAHVQRAVDCQTFSLREVVAAEGVARAIGLGGAPIDYLDRFGNVRLDLPSALAEVVATRVPVFLVSAEDNRRRYGAAGAERYEAIEARVRLPLLVEDELIAILSVGYWTPREFDEAERLFLTTVADLAAQALGRAKGSERLRADARRDRLLSAAQQAINRRLDPADQLRALSAVTVPELADFSSVHVLATPVPPGVAPALPVITERVACDVVDGVAPAPLQGAIAWYEGDPIVEAIRQGASPTRPMPTPQVPPWAMRTGTSATFRDGLNHVVLAPVQVDGLVVAVATFGMCNDRAPWDGADLEIIEAIAGYAAVALEHGLEHQRVRETALVSAWRAALVDGLRDALFVMDAVGNVVEVNAAFSEMLGYGSEGLPYAAPHPWWPDPAHDPAGYAAVKSAFSFALANGRGRRVLALRHRDGRRVWADCAGGTVPDRDGSGTVLLGVARDVTAAHRSAQRNCVLADVGRVLAESHPLADRLRGVLSAAVPVLGDLALVCLAGPDGRLAPAAVAGGELGPAEPFPAATDWTDGRPRVLDPDGGATLLGGAGVLDPGAPSAVLLAPLVGDGRVLGLLTFAGSSRSYDDADTTLALELGQRVAAAVEADRVSRREHELNEASTDLAAAATLCEAAAALAWALDRALDTAGVAVFATDSADPERLELLHTLGLPSEFAAEFPSVPLAADEAARTRSPVWLGDRRARQERYPGAFAATEEHAVVALPLTVGRRVAGVLAATFPTDRDFPPAERSFATTLATQAAQAFDRAALTDARWEAQQTELAARRVAAEAADRAERLGALASALVAAQTVADVAEMLTAHVQQAVASDTFSLREVQADTGTARVVRVGGQPPAYRDRFAEVSLRATGALTHVVATGSPVFIASQQENLQRFGPAAEQHYAAAGVEGLARLPLLVDGEVAAVLSLGYREPREFAAAERLFLTTVADLAAQALGRAMRTERLRADERRHRLLSAAQAAINQRLDPIAQLRALARVVVPELADFSTVNVLARPATPGRAPVFPFRSDRVACETIPGVEPAPLQRGIEWLDGDPIPETVRHGRLRTESVQTPGVPEFALRTGMPGPFRSGLNHLALTPVLVDDLVAAVATFGMCHERPPWSQEDLAILSEIAQYAAVALQHGLSYQHTRETALVLQHSLLSVPPAVPGLEIAARYRPAGRDEVGGDWYDAFALDDDRVALAVGDVVGHDIIAAAAMGQLRAVLRAFAMEDLDPGAVLDRVAAANRRLHITGFATAMFGRLVRLEAGWGLAWASAGHHPPLLVEPDGKARPLVHPAGGCALAQAAGARPYRVDRVRLDRPGTLLILYTDGLVERRGTHVDERVAALCERAEALIAAPIEEICDGLLADAPDCDDIALLVVRVGTEAASARL